MKNLILLISIAFLIVSCGQTSGEKSNGKMNENTEETTASLATGDLDFALDFINGYIDNLNSTEEEIDLVAWAKSNKLVTPEFTKDLTKIIEDANRENPEWGLGADPILDAQDYPDSGFKIVLHDPITNLIYLEGIDWDDFKLTMKAKSVNGKWLVDGCGVVNMPEEDRAER